NWYDEAISRRDPERLAEITEKMFCSSWGDDALWALGEIELERGNTSAARRCWEQLIEVPPGRVEKALFEAARAADLPADVAALVDKWYALDEAQQTHYRLPVEDILPDEASAALVRYWKDRRFAFTRLAYPGTTLALADIRARLILVSIMEGS